MATSYPGTFPRPLLAGFAGTVQMGVIRAEGPVDQLQRRVHMTMGHTFTLRFMMSAVVWASWRDWVSQNGYRWFLMDLPTIYAGLAGLETSPVLIRFTSSPSAAPVSSRDFQVSITAESAPSMISQYLGAARSSSYPAGLPAPQFAGYANETNVGLSAVQFEAGNRRQRRTAAKDREAFAVFFQFTTQQWWQWLSWVNQYGYDWHSLKLASAYSGLSISGEILIPHTVRYTSDIGFELVSPGIFRVSTQLEMDVSTVPQSIFTPSGNIYAAGTAASPATDKIVAGTAASPSSDIIIAGTATLPAD